MSGPAYWLYDYSVNGNVIYSNTMGFKLYPKGDVNHDGEVNVSDVMSTVNYILEKDIQGFFIEESDSNNDGSITIVDVMNIVNTVLGQKQKKVGKMKDCCSCCLQTKTICIVFFKDNQDNMEQLFVI